MQVQTSLTSAWCSHRVKLIGANDMFLWDDPDYFEPDLDELLGEIYEYDYSTVFGMGFETCPPSFGFWPVSV